MSERRVFDLFLDDMRSAPPGYTLVRTIEECQMLLEEVVVHRLSLDYHLGDGRKADEVTAWIVKTGHWPQEIYLHSSDEGARLRMYHFLKDHAPSGVIVHLNRR